jgi:hypothetical protein
MIDRIYKLKFCCGTDNQFSFHIYFTDNINFEICVIPTKYLSFERYYWINSKELRKRFGAWLIILRSKNMSSRQILI